ncbi:MAG TPA: Rieske 2Fe-2S domain-containing protein [Casimicrobiaceae bacterium]
MARSERLICASDSLVEGGLGVRFEVQRSGGPMPAFVVRFRGIVRAYINECQHQATELDWNPGDFFDSDGLYLVCATHGACYDPANGACIDGPCAGARLAAVEVHERDGAVYCAEE